MLRTSADRASNAAAVELARSSMRSVGILFLIALVAGTARAHPHAGGIVIRPDGTVVVGDVLGLRLLAIEPTGKWHIIPGVGHIRGLAAATDGTVYGVTWGQGGGVWKLDSVDRPVAVLDELNGLMARGDMAYNHLSAAR